MSDEGQKEPGQPSGTGRRRSPIPGWGAEPGEQQKAGSRKTRRPARHVGDGTDSRASAAHSATALEEAAQKPASAPEAETDPLAKSRRVGQTTRTSQILNAVARRPILTTSVLAVVVAGGLGIDYLLRRPSSAPTDAGPNGPAEVLANPADVPLPAEAVGLVRVYIRGGDGFVVLVNGEPIRLADEQLLTAPCEIAVDVRDTHRITIAKSGFRDATKLVTPSREKPTDLVFDPSPDDSGTTLSMLDAAYFDAEPGTPIALTALNTTARESDPYVTPDGLSIYFVREEAASSGLFVSTRATPFDAFGEPIDVRLTSGFDRPASPAIALVTTSAGDVHTHLAYALPSKGRVQSVVKRNVLGDFEDRDFLRYDPDGTNEWPAARLLGDGLGLYWTVREGTETKTYFSSRETVDEDFLSTSAVSLPSAMPRITDDGLRLHDYDGRTVRRARRAAVVTMVETKEKGRTVETPRHVPFSELEVATEVAVANFENDDRRRGYWVSDDEQWLFYSNDGDLFVARLREGRGWGRAPTGKPISNRTFEPEVAVTEPKPNPDDKPFEPPKEEPDPRLQPLPYAVHWDEFRELLSERRYDDAEKLCRDRLSEESFAKDRNLLAWDLEIVERLRTFWRDVDRGAASLKAGDTFRNKAVKLNFVSYADGQLVGTVGDKEFTVGTASMDDSDLVALADHVTDKADADGQGTIATFLAFEPDVVPRSLQTRMERAGDVGQEFRERAAARRLQLARHDFARENYVVGLAALADLRERFAGTKAAEDSEDVESKLYELAEWQTVGGRRWGVGPSGAYVADGERAEDSWLQSPRTYENFELLMEYRTTAELGAGGVFFRYPAGGRKPYQMDAAFKIQLANDAGVRADAFCTGALFLDTAPKRNAARRRGEWNTLRMVVRGQKVSVWINGEAVLDTTAVNDEIPLTGYVCLDGITGGITYRKIVLFALPKQL